MAFAWLRPTVVFFALLVAFCSAAGVVDVRLDRYDNPRGELLDGSCCTRSGNASASCPGVCETFLAVCLQPFRNRQPAIIDSKSCPYGSLISTRFADNAWRSDDYAADSFVNRIAFNYSWPGSATLIVELRHLTGDGDEPLIWRAVRSLRLDGLTGWRAVDSRDGRGRASVQLAVRVVCKPHYYGPDCAIHCLPKDDDWGHFGCSAAGVRVCRDGWTGGQCAEPICTNGCGNGHCVAPNVCRCRYGWQGPFCESCIAYEGCLHGYCVKPFECICNERWGGLQCDLDLDYCLHHQPCVNGATCVPHAPDNYTCVCPSGFAGRDCEIEVSSCWFNPCKHFGTCVMTGKGSGDYKCLCDALHSGTHCEFVVSAHGDDDGERAQADAGGADFTHSPCFYEGQYYRHTRRWETRDCRQCSCDQGRVNCTAAACEPGDCLGRRDASTPADANPAALLSPHCPKDQICESVTSAQCLSPPCRAPFGQCKPWHLLDAGPRASACADDAPPSDRCAHFLVGFDRPSLPPGTTVEGVCFELLLVLLTKQLDQFTTNCQLQSESPLVIRIELASVKRHWAVTGLKQILMDSLEQKVVPSDLLRKITFVRDDADSTGRTVNQQPEKYIDDVEASNLRTGLLLASAILLLLIAILILIALALLFRGRPQRAKSLAYRADPEGSADDEAMARPNNIRADTAKRLSVNKFNSVSSSRPEKMCNLWRCGELSPPPLTEKERLAQRNSWFGSCERGFFAAAVAPPPPPAYSAKLTLDQPIGLATKTTVTQVEASV